MIKIPTTACRPRLFPSALVAFTAAFLFTLTQGYILVSPYRPPSSSSRCLSTIASTSRLHMTTATTAAPSWDSLKTLSQSNPVGNAMMKEVELRKKGKGSAHVQNQLRLFGSEDEEPPITLFRDHAGWCPYCQKTMLLVEEKEIPIKVELVPMRSYGDKPREFLQKVPNGLLPAIEVNGQVITESQVIMELLDQWHSQADGYRPMLPAQDDQAGWDRYVRLTRLERELFSSWCRLVFYPDNGMMRNPFKSSSSQMSGSMQAFMDYLGRVSQELDSTKGPWFFDTQEYPTMIDFIYVSHVERMLASVAYWKGLNLRDVKKWNLHGLNCWLEAFEKREAYLAFKSDYYTHVMDIPPQYGPGYDGGFEEDRNKFVASILGRGGSWQLPLAFDDALQPLYKGPPLPLCVLKSMNLSPDNNGSYESCDPETMAKACRFLAAWKLADNGINVARFASRGGPQGSKNPRKSFQAQLADPYADVDQDVQPSVDAVLRLICAAMLSDSSPTSVPSDDYKTALMEAVVKKEHIKGTKSSLAYLRDRVGVPRDLPLAAARYLRAYLNWGIDCLNS